LRFAATATSPRNEIGDLDSKPAGLLEVRPLLKPIASVWDTIPAMQSIGRVALITGASGGLGN
jgi:hypothetical protein